VRNVGTHPRSLRRPVVMAEAMLAAADSDPENGFTQAKTVRTPIARAYSRHCRRPARPNPRSRTSPFDFMSDQPSPLARRYNRSASSARGRTGRAAWMWNDVLWGAERAMCAACPAVVRALCGPRQRKLRGFSVRVARRLTFSWLRESWWCPAERPASGPAWWSWSSFEARWSCRSSYA
jgi:hypothetical protein